MTEGLAKAIEQHRDAGDMKQWIWKDGKGGYEDVLKNLLEGDGQEAKRERQRFLDSASIITDKDNSSRSWEDPFSDADDADVASIIITLDSEDITLDSEGDPDHCQTVESAEAAPEQGDNDPELASTNSLATTSPELAPTISRSWRDPYAEAEEAEVLWTRIIESEPYGMAAPPKPEPLTFAELSLLKHPSPIITCMRCNLRMHNGHCRQCGRTTAEVQRAAPPTPMVIDDPPRGRARARSASTLSSSRSSRSAITTSSSRDRQETLAMLQAEWNRRHPAYANNLCAGEWFTERDADTPAEVRSFGFPIDSDSTTPTHQLLAPLLSMAEVMDSDATGPASAEVLALGHDIQAVGKANMPETQEESPLEMNDEDRTMQERWYGDIIRYYRDQHVPQNWNRQQHRRFKATAAEFRYNNSGILLKRRIIHTPEAALKQRNLWLRCLSPHEIAPLLQRLHDDSGHFNPRIVQQGLQSVWWPRMYKDIHDYVNGCFECSIWSHQTHSGPGTQPHQPLEILHPNEVEEMDLMGPFPPVSLPGSDVKYRYLLVRVDAFCHFGEIEPLPDRETETVCSALERSLNRTTDLMVVFYDPGTEFAMAGEYLRARTPPIYVRAVPTGSKRMTGTVKALNRVIRRCMERSAPRQIDRNGHLVHDLSNWVMEAYSAIKNANYRFMVSYGFTLAQIKFGLPPHEMDDRETRHKAMVHHLEGSPTTLPESQIFRVFQHITERHAIQSSIRQLGVAKA